MFAVKYSIMNKQLAARKPPRKSSVYKVMEQLETASRKWEENQNDALNACEWKECAICLVEYTSISKVIELKCHRNHVFHKKCFRKFLNGIKHSSIGRLKCPYC